LIVLWRVARVSPEGMDRTSDRCRNPCGSSDVAPPVPNRPRAGQIPGIRPIPADFDRLQRQPPGRSRRSGGKSVPCPWARRARSCLSPAAL